MRLSSIVLLLLISIQFNLLLHQSVTESFVTIPAWVAFGAITAAVKLKLILVKIMFALKTMGVGSIRFKRSAKSPHYTNSEYAEVLEAWSELEHTAGRRISFNLDSCISGATRLHVTETVIRNRKIEKLNNRKIELMVRTDSSDRHSNFVSSIIGSITGSITACQILEDALRQYTNHEGLHAHQ